MSATVVERKASVHAEPSSDSAISEEVRSHGESTAVKKEADTELKGVPVYNGDTDYDDDETRHDTIIVTGADAARHLLPLRDDGDPSLTFRSIFLATILSAFQAVMSQIYEVRLYTLFSRTTVDHSVQTDLHYHSRNLHCHHRLLPR
jgi:hypothetical protein